MLAYTVNPEEKERKLKPDFVTRKQKSENPKVALISGGGSGHEPLHGGFVGY